MFHNKIPKEYKNYPIGNVFQFPNKKYGSIDVLIIPWMRCKDCNCLLGDGEEKCSRCRSINIKRIFSIETCIYSKDTCKVNSWGCSIHHRDQEHSFTCVCDKCM